MGAESERVAEFGRRIAQLAQGQPYDKPFRYHDLGSAAYISRGRTVISAFGRTTPHR